MKAGRLFAREGVESMLKEYGDARREGRPPDLFVVTQGSRDRTPRLVFQRLESLRGYLEERLREGIDDSGLSVYAWWFDDANAHGEVQPTTSRPQDLSAESEGEEE